MNVLTRRLDRLESELRRNTAKPEQIVREVPCWQDPEDYLAQMVLRGEITEAQREDVLLIENVVLRPIHKRDDEGQIVGVVGSEVVSREELAP